MQPHQQVAFVLLEARKRGWPFGEAWRAAILSLPRPQGQAAAGNEMGEWLEALAWSRSFYAAAYAGVELPMELPGLSELVGELEEAASAAAALELEAFSAAA